MVTLLAAFSDVILPSRSNDVKIPKPRTRNKTLNRRGFSRIMRARSASSCRSRCSSHSRTLCTVGRSRTEGSTQTHVARKELAGELNPLKSDEMAC
eukprot:1194574-Prorocentrum_minimum.AAC.15